MAWWQLPQHTTPRYSVMLLHFFTSHYSGANHIHPFTLTPAHRQSGAPSWPYLPVPRLWVEAGEPAENQQLLGGGITLKAAGLWLNQQPSSWLTAFGKWFSIINGTELPLMAAKITALNFHSKVPFRLTQTFQLHSSSIVLLPAWYGRGFRIKEE